MQSTLQKIKSKWQRSSYVRVIDRIATKRVLEILVNQAKDKVSSQPSVEQLQRVIALIPESSEFISTTKKNEILAGIQAASNLLTTPDSSFNLCEISASLAELETELEAMPKSKHPFLKVIDQRGKVRRSVLSTILEALKAEDNRVLAFQVDYNAPKVKLNVLKMPTEDVLKKLRDLDIVDFFEFTTEPGLASAKIQLEGIVSSSSAILRADGRLCGTLGVFCLLKKCEEVEESETSSRCSIISLDESVDPAVGPIFPSEDDSEPSVRSWESASDSEDDFGLLVGLTAAHVLEDIKLSVEPCNWTHCFAKDQDGWSIAPIKAFAEEDEYPPDIVALRLLLPNSFQVNVATNFSYSNLMAFSDPVCLAYDETELESKLNRSDIRAILSRPENGRVFKIGGATGHTVGKFLCFGSVSDIEQEDVAQMGLTVGDDFIIVEWEGSPRFAANGDSGSLYFIEVQGDCFPIAIHSGSGIADGKHISFGSPVWSVQFVDNGRKLKPTFGSLDLMSVYVPSVGSSSEQCNLHRLSIGPRNYRLPEIGSV